jgi:site-specific DNA-methyltransferase (adenine-specific)
MLEKIICGDCVEELKKIPSGTIQCIIADPPYNIGKDFGTNQMKQQMDSYLSWCSLWIEECLRILHPDGSFFIYGFPEFVSFIHVRCIGHQYFARYLQWHYTNKNCRSRDWQRSHETILRLSKTSQPLVNVDDIREPYTASYLKNAVGKKRKGTKGRYGNQETTYKAHPKGALPRDVIKIPALAGGAGKKERTGHPTQKPLELCRRLIRSCKSNNTTVVLPFAGSGSECVAAKEEGCSFIGIELNQEYVDICKQRIDC